MEPIAAAAEDASLSCSIFPSPNEMRPPLVVLDDAAVGYVAGTPVLSRLNLNIEPDDRIALMGRNGNGKTTLARLLAGQLKPMAGGVRASGKLRVGYFAQHQIEELVPDETPLQHMSASVGRGEAGRGARPSSAASDSPATRRMSRCGSCRAASAPGWRSP